VGSVIFIVLGAVAAAVFFVYIGMKSPPQAVSANRKYILLTQSGHGVSAHRHCQHVDHVGLHLHAPDEPHHPAPPRCSKDRVILSSHTLSSLLTSSALEPSHIRTSGPLASTTGNQPPRAAPRPPATGLSRAGTMTGSPAPTASRSVSPRQFSPA
jgi:hypothetical protein